MSRLARVAVTSEQPLCTRSLSSSAAETPRTSNQHPPRLWARARNFWQVVMADYDSSDKGVREHKDLAMALLAHTHRKLRVEFPSHGVSQLLDQAISEMEDRGMEELGVRATRYQLQQALAPEIVHIFQAFQKVDGKVMYMSLNKHKHADDKHHYTDDYSYTTPPSFQRDCQARTILTREYQDTIVAMKDATTSSSIGTVTQEQSKEHVHGKCSSSIEFYRIKLGALHTLLSFHGWAQLNDDDACSNDIHTTKDRHNNNNNENSNNNNNNNNVNNDSDKPDWFGYIADGATAHVVEAIRNYQTQNLLRSALIRHEIGHSVIALKSTIQGAGRGVFIDGAAMEGSLLAFIPGQVLPKEYLLNPSPQLEAYLSQGDETFLLSLRSDDILIDSRKSPYTVLDDTGSNPWAIGHIVNHPPPNVIPNCRTVMVNFTEPMQLQATGLMRYVPNSYKQRPMLVGPRLLERENIVMHGMAIMARRDVANEELFYDYKFPTEDQTNNPSWYVDATYEDWADERDYE